MFIPISSPLVLTSAPPLFPLLTAASVWIYDSLTPSLLFKSLDFALIIPAVTVELRLNGFPTAKTHSPIWVASESPKKTYGSFLLELIFRTAISVSGSVPIILA